MGGVFFNDPPLFFYIRGGRVGTPFIFNTTPHLKGVTPHGYCTEHIKEALKSYSFLRRADFFLAYIYALLKTHTKKERRDFIGADFFGGDILAGIFYLLVG